MSRKRKSKQSGQAGQTENIPLLNPNAAGMDIGANEIYVAVPPGRDGQAVQRFGTFTGELGRLSEWLKQCGIDTVAMEATGVYWIPVYQILETAGFQYFGQRPILPKRSRPEDGHFRLPVAAASSLGRAVAQDRFGQRRRSVSYGQ